MPDINTNGLLPVSTNNTTWVAPSENFPVTLSNQQRGGVMVITGAAGDQLLNINGRLLQDGSVVFNQNEYTEAPGIVREANTYYRYVSGQPREADGTVPNASANWQALATGPIGQFTPVADIDALDVLATTPPANEAEYTILDPTDAENANPAIANLPTPVGGWTADLNLNVLWRTATADWLSLGFTVDNPDARYVNVVGDTMSGTLTMGTNADIVFTGTDDTNPDPNPRDITISVPNGSAAFAGDYEIVLPPEEPTNNKRLLRVSNVADQQGDIASPYTLAWSAGEGVWTRTGTNLSPTTAGDDVLLKVNETLSFTGTDDQDPAGESTITFQAPTGSAGFTANYTLTLPDTNGTPNQFLQTDGNGVLTWAAAALRNETWTQLPETNNVLTWDLDSNLLVFNATASRTIPIPTNQRSGQTGLLRLDIATTWPAAGGNVFQYADGAVPNITQFPAIIPYTVITTGTNGDLSNGVILWGVPTANIT